MTFRKLGVRWTVGDVSMLGFEALRLSMLGAYRAFGAEASYAVCVNTVPPAVARRRIGTLPMPVEWVDSTNLVPTWLRARFDERMAEGVAWKFGPLQVFPDRYELALDNDCILWSVPPAIEAWLESPAQCFVLAEDVKSCFGRFAELCGTAPRNSGIRGLPPGFDLGGALLSVLDALPGKCTSELDEQGLQVAALLRSGPVHVVPTEEVTICSPFWPHETQLGRSGAHFVGLNARCLPFRYYGRPASECVAENWDRLYPELLARCHPELRWEEALEENVVRGAPLG